MYISFLLALARTFVFHPSHGNPEHQVALNLRPKAWQVLTQCWLHDWARMGMCLWLCLCYSPHSTPTRRTPQRLYRNTLLAFKTLILSALNLPKGYNFSSILSLGAHDLLFSHLTSVSVPFTPASRTP